MWSMKKLHFPLRITHILRVTDQSMENESPKVSKTRKLKDKGIFSIYRNTEFFKQMSLFSTERLIHGSQGPTIYTEKLKHSSSPPVVVS